MATRMTANGVSTTTTPGTEQYEVSTSAIAIGASDTNTITGTLTENYSLVPLQHSQSVAENVMSGSIRKPPTTENIAKS